MENEWDQVAEEYSQLIGEQGDFVRQSIIAPEIKAVTDGLPSSARILDMGCGEGYVGRLLAGRDFKLVGVDYSQRLLDIAKLRGTPGEFIKADLNKVIAVGNDFDLVISNMVFMDIENIHSAYSNAYNSLKLKGELLLFIIHPALSRYSGKWVKTWTDKILRRDPFVRIDNYMQEGPRKVKIRNCRQTTTIWHRPLMKYITIPLKLGFRLIDFKEISPTVEDVDQASMPRFLTKIPEIIMMKFAKDE